MKGSGRVVKVAALTVQTPNSAFHPTLIWNEEEAVLVDTGLPGQLPAIQKEMEKLNVPFSHLAAIIITHQDLDHIGSLPDVLSAAEKPLPLYVHRIEKPYIEGELPLIKNDPGKVSEEKWAAMPEATKQLYLNPPKAKVTHVLEDKQELPFFGGIEVVYTPGHTPGHISLYVRGANTLIAGDAVVSQEGVLAGPVPRFTADMEEAMRSVEKFLDFEIEKIICYHGGVVTQNIQEQLEQLVK